MGSARASRVVDKRGYMGGHFRRQHPDERKMTFLSDATPADVHNSDETPWVPSLPSENPISQKFHGLKISVPQSLKVRHVSGGGSAKSFCKAMAAVQLSITDIAAWPSDIAVGCPGPGPLCHPCRPVAYLTADRFPANMEARASSAALEASMPPVPAPESSLRL